MNKIYFSDQLCKMDDLIQTMKQLQIEDRRTVRDHSLEDELSEMMSKMKVEKKFWFQHRYPPIQPPADEERDVPLESSDELDELTDNISKVNLREKIICYDEYFVIEKEDKKLIIWKNKKCSLYAEKLNPSFQSTFAF